jgi:pyruvate,water dikinase
MIESSTVPDGPNLAVIDLHDSRSTDASMVGAKAAQLASKAQQGFAVPRAVIFPWAMIGHGQTISHWAAGLEFLAPTSKSVILRSSAASEDGISESGAGRFLSIITEPTPSAIHFAATKIIEHAIREAEHQCSLILQEVPEIAWGGVCFSRHPIATERPILVIEAARGSAEPVAQGTRVDGTAIIERDAPWEVFTHGDPQFTEIIARRVGALSVALELISSTPQDIEWILDTNNRVWLIQTRHVTGLQQSRTEPGISAYSIPLSNGGFDRV